MRKRGVWMVAATMICATLPLLPVGCTRAQSVAPPPQPPPSDSSTAPRVVFPSGESVIVEIAADPDLRAQGLMYRDRLERDRGMLFFFTEDGEHDFWMRNTLIPLDMIWLDADRKIVGIRQDVPPCKVPVCPSYGVGVPSRFVLELAAGVAKEHGLAVGDRLRYENLDHVVPE